MSLEERRPFHVTLKYEESEVDSYDLDEVLPLYYDKLGISEEEVLVINPKFVDVPGYVYKELGVAGPHHPTGGSIGVFTPLPDHKEAQLQIIFYHDRNIKKTHYDGLPHWNQEIRLINRSGKEKLIRGEDVKGLNHVIPDSPHLDVFCLDPNGKPQKIRINRDDFRPRKE